MKKILTILLVGVISIGMAAATAYAGNSVTFAVSCSIPAVPGINAPPYVQDQTTARIEEPQLVEAAKPKPQEARAETIQETTEKEIELASGETASIEVETIYLR